MSILAYFILGTYCIALFYITGYCLLQFHLLYKYQKGQRLQALKVTKTAVKEADLPFVTVQLPIYNELYVIERLIDRVAEFNYPKDKYEIHILDDSTDETLDIVQAKVEHYKALGYQIKQIRRKDRVGYKAGALKEATKQAKGDFIAIFDADFLPRKDFLLETIPYFKNPKIGVVQTRWEHINQNYSVLTRLQAMQLNVHFTIEQQGRKSGNYMLQFNGTAGVWRKDTINSAGGWEADTLTEDLDLSYRAQLKGWEIVYLEKFGSPAELPAEMNGLKSQQFRWMKGGAETAKKMLPTIWQSDLRLGQKLHASGHLLGSTIFIFVFIAGVFSVPLLFALQKIGFDTNYFGFFLIGLLSVISVYYVANVSAEIKGETYLRKVFKFITLFPVFLALSMGLSLHNTIAVIQGWWGKKSPFVRTPKFNINGIKDTFRKQKYFKSSISWTTIFEGLLSLYFLFGVIAGLQMQENAFLIYHLLLMVGFGTIFYYSIRHLNLR
jgi:cellulose synthase/poly-beta-1,6-N-acetylglucosamine synthase-like glycosyltransferase